MEFDVIIYRSIALEELYQKSFESISMWPAVRPLMAVERWGTERVGHFAWVSRPNGTSDRFALKT